MKKYNTPSLEVHEIESMDVITVSGISPQFIKEGTSTNAGSGSVEWNPLWQED